VRPDRDVLEHLERVLAGRPVSEAGPALALVAAASLDLPEQELSAARRRALLVLAAGGDLHRELRPDERAVAVLAADLDQPERRRALAERLAALERHASSLALVEETLAALLADPELAWRFLACALLAEELAES
jgi:hypothetical protein